MNDEYDRSNQKVLKTYRSRLDDAKRENPELGWEWQFSNPSIPGYGVDVLWQESDQKHWFVKCPHCNFDWYLDFPDNVNFETKQKICSKCKKPLSSQNLIDGRWVAKTKSDVSGYWISQMHVPWISADKIIKDSMGDQEVFHNFVLGKPFISRDISVSRQAIMNCVSPGFNPKTNVAIGVDNGVEKHYVVGNRFGIFEIGKTQSWADIENLRNKYGAVMVIDAMPYPTNPTKITEKYLGKVFIHYYSADKKNLGIIRWDGGVVRSDRTKVFDYVVSEINSKDITFNLLSSELEDYITHWTNMYRMVKVNPAGIPMPRWETIEGRDDHFAHATILWRVALEQTLGQGGIVSINNPSTRNNSHPEIGPDSTVPALDLSDVLRRANAPKGKNWGSI
jgi:hypothetical protein